MGTSTGYKAPTTPKWKNLKRELDKEKLDNDLSDEDVAEILDSFLNANEGVGNLIDNGLCSRPNVVPPVFPPSGNVQGGGGNGGGGGASPTGGARGGGRGGGGGGQKGAAKRAAQRLGRFSAIVRESGFYEALRREGLTDAANRTPSRIVQFLVDYLAGNAASHDDADCRRAASKTLQELVQGADADEIQARMNAAMQADRFPGVLVTFFANMLHAQFGKALYEHIGRKVGIEKARGHHKRVLAFIKSKLRSIGADTNLTVVQWDGPQGADIVRDVYESTLSVFSKEGE